MQKIGSMKDELGGKIMTELAALTPKTYSHLEDDDDENKKKKHKKNVWKLKSEHFKNCLETTHLENEIN